MISALRAVAPSARDAWLDRALGLDALPDDGPSLPRDCVPYLPCSANVLLRAVDLAAIDASDVLVDVGAGVGRAAVTLHLLTGARTVGLEIQPALVEAARALAARHRLARATFLEGDAIDLTPRVPNATVFFLYCPFGARPLARWLDAVEPLARAAPLRICCVDLPLPARSWLRCDTLDGELALYRSAPA